MKLTILRKLLGDCSHEIKRHLLLGRKTMTNLDSILKSRDITLPTKVCLVKAMVFLVVMYGCESWTIKTAECWRIGAFELCYWRRLLRVPWIARRSNQSILKEISPEYSLEGLMLKLQYFSHLMWRTDSFEKTPVLGKIEGRRRRGHQRMRWLDGTTWLDGHKFEQAPGVGDGQGGLACCSPGITKSQTWLSVWTELKETPGHQNEKITWLKLWTYQQKDCNNCKEKNYQWRNKNRKSKWQVKHWQWIFKLVSKRRYPTRLKSIPGLHGRPIRIQCH